jgi:FkbM family methyltransferase
MLRGGYEANFDAAMFESISAGDCAWDVGANIGLYTAKLAGKVGASGLVYAFEPSTANRAALASALVGRTNTSIIPVALGSSTGRSHLVQGRDANGTTSQLVPAAAPESEEVEIVTGDRAVAQGIASQPNFIKIDTEGHELDVLQGLGDVLKMPELRTLGIEVHFGLLAKRGMASAPAEIENILHRAGFAVAWTDASHILASRKR